MPSEGRVYRRPFDWLTRSEAADYTGLSVSTIRRAVRHGELQEGGTKGKRLYRREWLDTWLTRSAMMVIAAIAVAVLTAFATMLVACALGADSAQDMMRRMHCPLAPPIHHWHQRA